MEWDHLYQSCRICLNGYLDDNSCQNIIDEVAFCNLSLEILLAIFDTIIDNKSSTQWQIFNRLLNKRYVSEMNQTRETGFPKAQVLRISSKATEYVRESHIRFQCEACVNLLDVLYSYYANYQWVPYEELSDLRQSYLIALNPHDHLHNANCRNLFANMRSLKQHQKI